MSKQEEIGVASRIGRKSLGEILVDHNVITAQQLEKALNLQQKQGGKLRDILVNERLVKADDLAMVLSVELNIPLIDLKRHSVKLDALRFVPEDMARKYTLIPLDVIGDSLVVVMADPEDIQAIKDLEAHSQMRVEVVISVPSDIEKAISLNYKPGDEVEGKVSRYAPISLKTDKASSKYIATTPIAESLDLLIEQAVRDRASDVHIEPQENGLRVRYRIDGVMQDMYSLPTSAHAELVSRIKILADMDIAQQKRPQDGQFSIKIEDTDVDIRAATMEAIYGERVTLRILDKSLSIFTLPELGFLPDALKKHQAMLNSPFGIILVGGPTGSGKTTTLYTSINQLDRIQSNILTIEDPIEYRFKDLSQSQVNSITGVTFAGGLRAILRQDPDVIMVGEIRDKDTAKTAVQAAITGHLVLSSIHANDAVSVLLRLKDLGVESSLISSTLIGAVAQRMVRRICPECRVSMEPSAEERGAYEEEMKQDRATFYSGAGCHHCANTGFRGRTGIFEMLIMSDEIRKMVFTDASTTEIKAQALREGMVTMKHDGMLKVKEGITSVSEVLRGVFTVN